MNQNNISLKRVIKGLECHARAIYGEIDEYGLACNQCPYKDMGNTCHSRTEGDLISDALDLLKAQEPVSVQKKQMEMVGLQTWDWVCGNCGQTVLFNAKFCPWCGRAVMWDA